LNFRVASLYLSHMKSLFSLGTCLISANLLRKFSKSLMLFCHSARVKFFEVSSASISAITANFFSTLPSYFDFMSLKKSCRLSCTFLVASLKRSHTSSLCSVAIGPTSSFHNLCKTCNSLKAAFTSSDSANSSALVTNLSFSSKLCLKSRSRKSLLKCNKS